MHKLISEIKIKITHSFNTANIPFLPKFYCKILYIMKDLLSQSFSIILKLENLFIWEDFIFASLIFWYLANLCTKTKPGQNENCFINCIVIMQY